MVALRPASTSSDAFPPAAMTHLFFPLLFFAFFAVPSSATALRSTGEFENLVLPLLRNGTAGVRSLPAGLSSVSSSGALCFTTQSNAFDDTVDTSDTSNPATSGAPSGAATCARAVISQICPELLAAAFGGRGYSVALSDSTCDACGSSGYCPLGSGSYADLNKALFLCRSGGTKESSHGYSIAWCAVTPSAGLIAMVIILPLFGLGLCVAGCVVGRRRRAARAAQAAAMVAPGLPMQQMGVMPLQQNMMYMQPQASPMYPSPPPPVYAAAPAPAPPFAPSPLAQWLNVHGVVGADKALAAAGANSVDDLRFLGPDDVAKLGLTPVAANKLTVAISAIPRDDGPSSI